MSKMTSRKVETRPAASPGRSTHGYSKRSSSRARISWSLHSGESLAEFALRFSQGVAREQRMELLAQHVDEPDDIRRRWAVQGDKKQSTGGLPGAARGQRPRPIPRPSERLCRLPGPSQSVEQHPPEGEGGEWGAGTRRRASG